MGSNAMPQIGQSAGLSVMISGCMGQVYWVPAGMASACFLWAPDR